MLKAKKSEWFECVFRAYNRNLLRRRFGALHFRGGANLRPDPRPTIVVANHTSWWDGLVCFEIFKSVGADGYVFMEEKNLRRYAVFRRLGAFSIDRGHPRSAFESFEYAAELAREKSDRSFLIFPQGKIVPDTLRPIAFESGIRRVIDRLLPCRVVPLALAYKFRGEFKPVIFATAGATVPFARHDVTESVVRDLAANLGDLIDSQECTIANDDLEDYINLIQRRYQTRRYLGRMKRPSNDPEDGQAMPSNDD